MTVIYMTKMIEGVEIQFRVKHQFRTTGPSKVIDVFDGVGMIMALNWRDALAAAHELASIPRAEWQKRNSMPAWNTPRYPLPR
jgi:hypothetical protein